MFQGTAISNYDHGKTFIDIMNEMKFDAMALGNHEFDWGLEVMQALNDKCNEWKRQEDIDYSLYGSPIESTTYKFAKCLKKRFGDDIFIKLDGFDRNYITNSYH